MEITISSGSPDLNTTRYLTSPTGGQALRKTSQVGMLGDENRRDSREKMFNRSISTPYPAHQFKDATFNFLVEDSLLMPEDYSNYDSVFQGVTPTPSPSPTFSARFFPSDRIDSPCSPDSNMSDDAECKVLTDIESFGKFSTDFIDTK